MFLNDILICCCKLYPAILYECCQKCPNLNVQSFQHFLVASSLQSFNWLVTQLQLRFSLSHKEANMCLGIKIVPDTLHGFTIGQQHYLESLLVEFGMQDCKPAPTPLAKGEIDALTAGNTGGKPLGDKEHHMYRQIVG